MEKVFAVGKQMDAYAGLFAMTTVKNQDDIINTAWEYLDKCWLAHSMYQYGEGEYFEEYIIHMGRPYKLKLYLPVMQKKEYLRIRLEHLNQQTVMAAMAKGINAEHKAANAVLEYFKTYYSGDLKYLSKFYIRQLSDGFVYGIFTEKPEESPKKGTLKRKVIPQGMYLILEGESVGDYHTFESLLISFATESSLQINEEEIFGIYYTDYGFKNPRLSLFAAVNMENSAKAYNEEIKGYQPKTPEIIRMTESICSVKVKEMLEEAGTEYMFVEKEAFHMVGRRCVTPEGGGAWGVARADGTIEKNGSIRNRKAFLRFMLWFWG